MDFNKLYQFLRIVEAGNISRAALALKLPKSQVSRNLSLLEQSLGHQLVYRTTRNFELTSNGRELYEKSKVAYQTIQSSLDHLHVAQTELSGTLRLTAPDDIGIHILNPILDQFRKLHPKVQLEAIYTHETLNLVSEGIDVAIRVGRLKDSSLKKRHAGQVELILVCAPQYLKICGNLLNPEKISELETLAFYTKKKSIQWHLQSPSGKLTLNIKPSIAINNYSAICDFAVRGYGIGLIPNFLCEPHIKSGALVHLLKSWKSAEVPLQLVTPHQKNVSTLTKTFVQFFAEKMC